MSKYRMEWPIDWTSKTNALFSLADELKHCGFHHLPAHAEAMRLALGAAHTAASGNHIGLALKELGAFWDIFRGRLDEHPEYAMRDSVRALHDAQKAEWLNRKQF